MVKKSQHSIRISLYMADPRSLTAPAHMGLLALVLLFYITLIQGDSVFLESVPKRSLRAPHPEILSTSPAQVPSEVAALQSPEEWSTLCREEFKLPSKPSDASLPFMLSNTSTWAHYMCGFPASAKKHPSWPPPSPNCFLSATGHKT